MFNNILVEVIYENNLTIVFKGELIEDYEYNKEIWEVIFMKDE
jgi:hypothetical protein